ncbi:hypothetical protein [Flavobacterium sp.]|uniref:hypothetical protein n=1 Tax=Flavobacterium sp. TaxID=239 RepID=UPI0037506D29
MITLEKLTNELNIQKLDLIVGGGKKVKSLKSGSGSASSHSSSSHSSSTSGEEILVGTK